MMENKRLENLAEIEKVLKKLPQKAQMAIHWTIVHMEFVLKMCTDFDITNEEIESCKKYAISREDYLMLASVSVAQMIKNSDETLGQ